MERFKLERTGDLPLSFEGERVAQSKGKWHSGKDQNRWHDLAIYRTKGGRYLLQITYQTQWQGESDHSQIIDCGDDVTSAVVELKAHDPASHVEGYPPGEQYSDRQRMLVEGLTRRYNDQITELFREIPEAEERIE
jgi:hypothetical protein